MENGPDPSSLFFKRAKRKAITIVNNNENFQFNFTRIANLSMTYVLCNWLAWDYKIGILELDREFCITKLKSFKFEW